MSKKYMKRCSAPLIIREMQVKTIMRYHLIPIRMVNVFKKKKKEKKKQKITNVDEDVGKLETLCPVGGNVK